VTADDLEYALMQHFPRKVIVPSVNAQVVIDEFRAFFDFLAREYGLERAAECLEFLRSPGIVDDFHAAMYNSPVLGMVESVFAGGLSDIPPEFLGLPPGFTQSSFKDPSPDVGRNDPCPCGSGKKYKKCCLMKG
jgi:hypothetical protein